ncbi:MAG TPA: DUF86 domain-containing protein [Rhizobiaceae bacterium]|nr:DUF86 domain-containing protein [Rhizobiaceae bacterium]
MNEGLGSVEGLSESEFLSSSIAQNSACWCIVCVGEAAGAILKDHRSFACEELERELKLALSARNRFAHGYFDLDMARVWLTLTISFPHLLALVDAQSAANRDMRS